MMVGNPGCWEQLLPQQLLAGTALDCGLQGSAWLGWEIFSANMDLHCRKPSLRLPGLIVAAGDRNGLAVETTWARASLWHVVEGLALPCLWEKAGLCLKIEARI